MPCISKISVIIPVYNVERYIEECLTSVCNQSLRDIEIICVGDRGQDGSMDIVREYAATDLRIHIIQHEVNKGLCIARNTGMDAATGEYLFFLDSDDYIAQSDILEKLHDKIITTQSDVAVCRTFCFPDDPLDVALCAKAKGGNEEVSLAHLTDYYRVSLKHLENAMAMVPVIAWNKLYSTAFIRKNNLRFADKKIIHEDNGFSIKLLVCEPHISAISDIGVMYRQRRQSITAEIARAKRRRDKRLAVDDAISYIENRLPNEEAQLAIKAVKNMYAGYFPKPWHWYLCQMRWMEHDKLVRILLVPLLRQKARLSGEKVIKTTKIFGISISKEELKTLPKPC